jgi:DNA polymerase-3 subunit alpha
MVPEVPRRERLGWEKEALGLFLSDHPFQEAARWLRRRVTATTASIGEDSAGERVVVAGVLSGVRRIITKRKDTMLVAQLEDLHGSIELVVFPRTFERTGDVWQDDSVVIVEGKADQKRLGGDDRAVRQIICESVECWTPPPPGSEPPPEAEDEAAVLQPAPALPAWAAETVDEPDASAADRPGKGTGASADQPPAAVAAGAAADEPAALVPAPPADEAASGAPAPPAGAPAPLAPAPLGRLLRLRFVRAGDDAADLERLRSLHVLLAGRPGPDRFELIVVQGQAQHRLVVPEPRVGYSPDVERALCNLLGAENVRVS